MDYYEGIIRNTEFFTTTELSEKLKMNVQVLTRKIQAGEIMAYKIGKDWRIPEQSVFAWLEQHSNKDNKKINRSQITKKKPVAELGKQKKYSIGKKKFLLEYILAQFEPAKSYTEKEINRIICRFNSNYNSVRKELISNGMMDLSNGNYKRRSDFSLNR